MKLLLMKTSYLNGKLLRNQPKRLVFHAEAKQEQHKKIKLGLECVLVL